jgi:hypothetical protein
MKRHFLSTLAMLALAAMVLATEPAAQSLPEAAPTEAKDEPVPPPTEASAETTQAEAPATAAQPAATPAQPAAEAPVPMDALRISLVKTEQPKAAPAAATPPVCGQPCGNCCPSECERGIFLADFGFLILKPHWKTNPALFVNVIDADVPGAETAVQKDFTDAAQFVPRLSFGYLNSRGFGGRIGWWGFATSQTEFLPDGDEAVGLASAGPLGLILATLDDSVGMSAAMALRLDVWDLELAQLFEGPCWNALLTGGLRYAHQSQDYHAVVLNEDGPGNFMVSGHNFTGAGPTLALALRRYFGQALYVAGTTRGSLLFGQGEQTAAVAGTANGELVVQQGYASYDMVLPVAELEVGGGWSRKMGPGFAFVEAGLAAQAWIEAGNASRSDNPDVLGPIFGGTTADPTLGLFGFYLKAGLTY